MITVGMNYEILEGKDDAFEKKFARVLEVMAESKGHVKTNLYKDVFKNRSYLIVSEWQEKGSYDAFVQSETFGKVVDWGKEHILAGRPKHQVYGDEAPPPAVAGKCPAH